MTDPARSGVKTLGVKLSDELHAQFALVAQLDDMSLADAVKRAVEHYVEYKRSESGFAAKAKAALEEIQREAMAQQSAIQSLFGAEAPTAKTDDTVVRPLSKPSSGRKTAKPEGSPGNG
ncbi:hypothetical protein [Fodinicola acaciae]|uniref:hypothetical protein n=1 Tax=Fodinicola acaciae TaxID=2681555 RepID=UPI001C9E3609|nr:hypothetical protein [Fodinicola acaciae]